MGGSGGVRLGASGPGGSTPWDLAVLGDGAARPERHRQRRIATSSAPAEQGEAAALGCCGAVLRDRDGGAWRGGVRERARARLKGRGRPRRAGPGLTRRDDPAGSLREVDRGGG